MKMTDRMRHQIEPAVFEGLEFLRSVVDTVPSLVFIVDDDMRIYFANAAAQAALVGHSAFPYKMRSGEALNCLNAELAPGGCGRALPCRECVIRNSVSTALRGEKISRKGTFMRFRHSGDTKEAHLSVSATAFTFKEETFALLLLEDITELMDLRSILPICMHCKNIRQDDGYWQRVEKYFSNHVGVDFSHSICPTCVKKFYPNLYPKIADELK